MILYICSTLGCVSTGLETVTLFFSGYIHSNKKKLFSGKFLFRTMNETIGSCNSDLAGCKLTS